MAAAFNLAGPIFVPNSDGPICCCGCGKYVGRSFHKCKICDGRTWAGFCFVGDGEEGMNGICHACDKGGRASKASEASLFSVASANRSPNSAASSSQADSSSLNVKRWTGNSERVNRMKRKNVSEDFSSPPAKKKARQSPASSSSKKGSVLLGSHKAPSKF